MGALARVPERAVRTFHLGLSALPTQHASTEFQLLHVAVSGQNEGLRLLRGPV